MKAVLYPFNTITISVRFTKLEYIFHPPPLFSFCCPMPLQGLVIYDIIRYIIYGTGKKIDMRTDGKTQFNIPEL